MSLEYINGIIVDSDSFRDHSITFGEVSNLKFVGKNTWHDWHLIPASKPIVAEAGVSTKYMEIPGRLYGPIDISEYLTGDVLYGARSGSFQFMLHPDFERWEDIRSEIVDYLHGKKMKMCLSDDPEFFYKGRFSIGDVRSEASCTTIKINYAVETYKYFVLGNNKWLWDPFNFETDAAYPEEGRL